MTHIHIDVKRGGGNFYYVLKKGTHTFIVASDESELLPLCLKHWILADVIGIH